MGYASWTKLINKAFIIDIIEYSIGVYTIFLNFFKSKMDVATADSSVKAKVIVFERSLLLHS